MSRQRAFVAAALSLAVVGCGHAPGGPARLDGTYRLTTSTDELARIDAPGEPAENPGSWTLVLDHGRFAFTRESDRGCTWAYGALELGKDNLMDWTVIDGGGAPPGTAANQPTDTYRFRWSRYRDVLTLTATKGHPAGYFVVKPWRRIADTPDATDFSRRCPPPTGALEPTGAERARPSDATIELSGDLVNTGPTSWVGSVASRQLGPGRLALSGHIDVSPAQPRARLTFAARFSQGELHGCLITAILRRPHGRYLWESSGGQITGTSPGLRTYLGLTVDMRGVTTTDHPRRVRGSLKAVPAEPGDGAASRDLC